MHWVPVEGPFGVIFSFVERVVVKVIVDFSGCLAFRHPGELGGTAFSLSLLWAQAMPFLALLMFQRLAHCWGTYLAHILRLL